MAEATTKQETVNICKKYDDCDVYKEQGEEIYRCICRERTVIGKDITTRWYMENQYYKANKKIRKTWLINPSEKIKESIKQYKRTSIKQDLKKIIDEELEFMDEY